MTTAGNSRVLRTIPLMLIVALFCPFNYGKIIYIDDDAVGSNDGSSWSNAYPFLQDALGDARRVPADYATIQMAIEASTDGDAVLVAPGTYTGEGNRDIDFKGKAITVKSEYGPDTCIINCQGSPDEYHRGFYFHNDEDANSFVQGFTIINGYAARGGGIFCESASPNILDCLITENTAFERGGGVQCEYSNPTITHCFIQKNSAYDGGGVGIGTTNSTSSLLTMTNCSITGNKAMRSGGGICCKGKVNFSNCTVFGNSAGLEGGGIRFFLVVGKRIKNSIIYGNMAFTGSEIAIITPAPGLAGCGDPLLKITNSVVGSDPNAIYFTHCHGYLYGEWLRVDPLFANPGYWDANSTPDDPNDDFWIDGDYHLKSQAGRWDPNSQSWVQDNVTSPCIDAGDPNSPIGHEPFPNGGIINMGAYGGTVEASKSYFGKPVCETIIAGDINGDCKVDFDDLMILMNHWLQDYTPQD